MVLQRSGRRHLLEVLVEARRARRGDPSQLGDLIREAPNRPDVEADDGDKVGALGRRLTERPALDEMLAQLRPGDTVVIWRLDRLGRSLRHLLYVLPTSMPAASQ
ncbi:MAG: recombinase family protein [Candidatus Nanopelagicales bacterium]